MSTTLACTALSLSKPTSTKLHSRPTTLHTALSSSTNLSHLKQLHAQILKSNLHRSDPDLLSQLLLSSFTLSPSLHYPLSLFHLLPQPHTHLYNNILRHLSRSPDPEKALFLYQRMRSEGVPLDRFSFPPLLKAVSRASALAHGIEIHGLVCRLGFHSDPFVQTVLVRMYAACRRVWDARWCLIKCLPRMLLPGVL